MLILRPAGPADARTLSAFGARTYTAHYGDLWSPAALAPYLERHYGFDVVALELGAPDEVRYLLAERDGILVGYAKVRPDRAVPTRPDEHGLELEKLYVAAGATGGGVGSLLIEQSRAYARDRGQAQVWLDVLRTNAGGIRLYRRHGFEIVGEIGFATDLVEIGMYIMCGAVERVRA